MLKKDSHRTLNYVSYLDVSEYIIKEPSPLLKPSSPQQFHPDVRPLLFYSLSQRLVFISTWTPRSLKDNCISFHQHFKNIQSLTPEDSLEIESIKGSPSQVVLTPITSGLIRVEVQDIMDEFMLQSPQFVSEEEGRRRRGEKLRTKKCPTYELFRLQSDLDKIVEYDHEQSYFSDYDSSEQSYISRLDEEQCGLNSNTFFTSWSKKTQSKELNSKDMELQNQTTVDHSLIDYSQNIQNFSRNPKTQILTKISQIQALSSSTDQKEKDNMIKQYLQGFLLDYENHCFQESWKELTTIPNKDYSLVREGLEETFNKKIGPLSFECRRVKLLKYLEKKKRRIWKKKVSYDCRKKVADGRLRIKGKFVTREQACEQLGVETLESFSAEEIKDMLERKIDEAALQLSQC